jgi:hypothetical protein
MGEHFLPLDPPVSPSTLRTRHTPHHFRRRPPRHQVSLPDPPIQTQRALPKKRRLQQDNGPQMPRIGICLQPHALFMITLPWYKERRLLAYLASIVIVPLILLSKTLIIAMYLDRGGCAGRRREIAEAEAPRRDARKMAIGKRMPATTIDLMS